MVTPGRGPFGIGRVHALLQDRREVLMFGPVDSFIDPVTVSGFHELHHKLPIQVRLQPCAVSLRRSN
eukprot:3938842-Alexandrium_andersonii.AAC.1